jgi:uncharacterized repeat protein (TIGR03803 family)
MFLTCNLCNIPGYLRGRFMRVALLAAVALSASAQTLGTLYSFAGGNSGANPSAGVVLTSNGYLLGTTPYGGASGYGTVFELFPPTVSGEGWTETALYSFQGGKDGANPGAALTQTKIGIYGTTVAGGRAGAGTVFELLPPASKGAPWTETPVYTFQGQPDGSNPQGGLVYLNGALYGTTFSGGASGAGTVFQLTPPTVSGGAWTEAVIYSFKGGADGSGPESAVTGELNGSLFGTTCCGSEGIVYELQPPSTAGGTWTKFTLYSFATYSTGAFPYGTLVLDKTGLLYGTTSAGGSYGAGIIFYLKPPTTKGDPYILTTIHSFTGGADGGNPYGAVVQTSSGVLYTAVTSGGAYGSGAVVQFSPPTVSGGTWTETVLYSFTGLSDGSEPFAGMTFSNESGTLYGTTVFGGATGYGTVYELAP